jgi:hypothetical protein
MLGPVPAYPMNTPSTPEAWTRVDLRSHELPTGTEFHAGCQFRSQHPILWGDDLAITSRSHIYQGGNWSIEDDADYHIRAVLGQITDVSENPSTVPLSFSLLPAYPNPFNPTCTIPFTLDRRGHVQLLVYDILGQKVAILVDGVQDAGWHRITWNAGNLASGIYFLQLKSLTDPSAHSPIRKLVLLK